MAILNHIIIITQCFKIVTMNNNNYCNPPYFSEPFFHASFANGLCALIKMWTVNKDVEEVQETGEKWRKYKIVNYI